MHEELNATSPRLFVVYAPEDRPFVEGFLLQALALPAGSVLESTKLELGVPIVGEIARGAVSPVTVVVVSPHLLGSPWAQFASELAAHHRVTATGRHVTLVPVLLADCEVPLWLAHLVSLEFRKGDRQHWETEAGKLRAALAAEATEEKATTCPYPGMRAFEEREAAFFHGREADVGELLGRLRSGEREIYVIGPSGSGKSSLVVACSAASSKLLGEVCAPGSLGRTIGHRLDAGFTGLNAPRSGSMRDGVSKSWSAPRRFGRGSTSFAELRCAARRQHRSDTERRSYQARSAVSPRRFTSSDSTQLGYAVATRTTTASC